VRLTVTGATFQNLGADVSLNAPSANAVHLSINGVGMINISSSFAGFGVPLLANTTATYDVGGTNNKFRDLYISRTAHLGGAPKFEGTNTTGSGSAALGANCPAVTATAPYTWIQVTTSDGSTGYLPVWK
jgi:hypothetical protein